MPRPGAENEATCGQSQKWTTLSIRSKRNEGQREMEQKLREAQAVARPGLIVSTPGFWSF